MKKFIAAALVTLTAIASTQGIAEAKILKLYPLKHHHHHHHGDALAIGAGLAALGIIAAASQARSEPVSDCWIEKRVYFDYHGHRHIRRVQVCE